MYIHKSPDWSLIIENFSVGSIFSQASDQKYVSLLALDFKSEAAKSLVIESPLSSPILGLISHTCIGLHPASL